MTKIIPLKPALDSKWLESQNRKFDPQSLFALDYGDVTRQYGDAANGDSADPVHFGSIAEAQMLQLCDAFGFARLPATWGEFKGVILYCKMFQGMLLGARDGPLAEDARRHALGLMQQYFPLDYDAAVAFFDNDIIRLREIHTEGKTLERLAKEHLEFPKK